MPIPSLLPCGLLPHGVYDCSVAEIEQRYAINQHRQNLWDSFKGFLAWLDTQPRVQHMYIDGGFTSDKTTPKDIDVVLDLTGCSDQTSLHWIGIFFQKRSDLESQYKVDFWVKHPVIGNDLVSFFHYVRVEELHARNLPPDTRKGLLRVSL